MKQRQVRCFPPFVLSYQSLFLSYQLRLQFSFNNTFIMQSEEQKVQQVSIPSQNQEKQEETHSELKTVEQFPINPLSFEAAKQNYIDRYGIPLITISYGQRFNIKIETNRLIMESMRLDDAYFLHKYLWSQPTTMKLFASGTTKTLEQTEKRVTIWDQRWKNEDPFAGMNIRNKYSGDYVGYVVMGHGNELNSSEIAYVIRESQWGKGYGTESVGATVLFLSKILKKNNFKVNNIQQFKRIIATSHFENPTCKRIFEKLGFSVYKRCQKFGSLRDHFELKFE